VLKNGIKRKEKKNVEGEVIASGVVNQMLQ